MYCATGSKDATGSKKKKRVPGSPLYIYIMDHDGNKIKIKIKKLAFWFGVPEIG